MEGYHKPVLLREVVNALGVNKSRWYLDATLGDGGYSIEILKLGGCVLGIDADLEAVKRSRERFDKIGIDHGYYRLVQGNFRELGSLVKKTGLEKEKFSGVVFDLGVSSELLEEGSRGFSFTREGPLDMRIDQSLGVTAADLVNGLNRGELYELFQKLAEEKFAKGIADTIISARQVKTIRTTKQLAELIAGVYRRRGIRKWQIHPATKAFQALRIAVNDELNALREGLPQSLEVVGEQGKIVAVSFHSLEDRIVKQTFRDWNEKGLGKILTKKPVVPKDEELKENIRARSSKMRVFEKY